jgi:hypothetical protein
MLSTLCLRTFLVVVCISSVSFLAWLGASSHSSHIVISAPPVRKIVILDYKENSFFDFGLDLNKGCEGECELVKDDNETIADAVVYHLPNLIQKKMAPSDIPLRAHPDQLYIGISMEPPNDYVPLTDAKWMQQWNLTAGYLQVTPENKKN